MKIKLILWLIISLFFSSCSNNIYVKRNNVKSDLVREINYLGARKTGEIKIGENESYKVKNINISNDSIFYLDLATANDSILSIWDLSEITFNDHFVGLTYGLVWGFGIGILVGIAIDPDVEGAGLGGIGYASAGALVGSIYGGVIGIKRKYIFIEE